MRAHRLPALLAAAALVLAAAGAARAHIVPTGVGMQTFVRLGADKVEVEYNLGFSDLNGYEQVLKMETSHDDILQAEEIEAWLDQIGPKLAAGLDVRLDGKRLELKIVKRRVLALFPGTNVKEIAGAPFDTFWNLECAVAIGPGPHTIEVADKNFEREIAQSIMWLPRPDARFRNYAFTPQPPDALLETHAKDWAIYARAVKLEVELAAAPAAPAATTSSEDMRKKAEEAAAARGVTLAASLESAPRALGGSYRGREEVEEGTRLTRLGGEVWYVALGLALLWGAAHALAPGHGKSMVAAYLLGTEGRIGDAVALGGIVTITHAGIIFVIAVATFAAAEYVFGISRTSMQGYSAIGFELASGALVAVLGVRILVRRVGQLRRGEAMEDHSHGPDGHHHHGPGGHAHAHDHAHPHAHGERSDVLSLGLAAGLQPCTAGMTLVAMSVTQGWLWKGLYLLLAFSLGLGLVIVSIAVSMVVTKQIFAERFETKEGRFLRQVLPLVSASLLAAVGCWMVVDCLVRNRLL
jgi:ABC-type nickel/cobalt efflux system permease component RcnA